MKNNERSRSVHFSQDQVAEVTKVLDLLLPYSEQKLTVRMAPPGARQINLTSFATTWQELSVRWHTTPSAVVGSRLQLARRTQFTVRYHLTSTIQNSV
jgi:hypothetical protein